jgi:hypothetical protein
MIEPEIYYVIPAAEDAKRLKLKPPIEEVVDIWVRSRRNLEAQAKLYENFGNVERAREIRIFVAMREIAMAEILAKAFGKHGSEMLERITDG